MTSETTSGVQSSVREMNTNRHKIAGLFAFLVSQRSFVSLVVVTWGFMLGGATLLTATFVTTMLLSSNAWVALLLSCLLGGYVVYFASSGMWKIYHRPQIMSTNLLWRLFAQATLYGLIAPFHMTYLLSRLFYLKRKLIYVVQQTNKAALGRREEYNRMHQETMRLRDNHQRKSGGLPRGSSQTTVIRLKIEDIRHRIQRADENNEAHLLKCRQVARELGVVLREEDNFVSLPPNVSIANLLLIQIRRVAVLGST